MKLIWNKQVEVRLGIASSIAKESGFSWEQTIADADRLGVSLVQLYLPPEPDSIQNYMQLLDASAYAGFSCYFHLPDSVNSNQLKRYQQNLGQHSKSALFILHEKYFSDNLLDVLLEQQLMIGIENDAPGPEIDLYLKRLSQLNKYGINLTVVFDYSRFYAQFYEKYGTAKIAERSAEIIRFCRDHYVPLVLHVIDHWDVKAQRENWTVLFDGRLPWKKLIKNALDKAPVLKSLVFEYENYNHTEQSIWELGKWITSISHRNI
jgi:hypothetical protein